MVNESKTNYIGSVIGISFNWHFNIGYQNIGKILIDATLINGYKDYRNYKIN